MAGLYECGNEPPEGPSEHTHPPNREEAEAEIVKQGLKRKAAEHPERRPAQVLHIDLGHVPSGVLALLPERSNLNKAVRSERQRHLPPNPTALNNLP
ncbi:hypothetical protein ANN_14179 [Periplaneta americana]|uniref:Uncharacterized protein n=1 Tax=Periplaneta americana TaxID=6978 RepID=A0ABQ8SXR2_PERAM|nr:hypothetical protein ANN_14179 [Periplaneta americana]